MIQKNEFSPKKKSLTFKTGPESSKTKTEILSSSRNSSSSSLPPHLASSYYFGRTLEDECFKRRLLKLLKDHAKDTSRDSRGFMREISKFADNRNQYKVSFPENILNDSNKSKIRNDSKIFSSMEDFLDKSKLFEKSKRELEKTMQVTRSKLTAYLDKKDQRKLLTGNQKVSKFFKKSSSDVRIQDRELKPSSWSKTSYFKRQNRSRENVEAIKSVLWNSKRNFESSFKQQLDTNRNSKPVSLLMQNPLKEAESTVSVELYSKKKVFTPIEELSLCSEIQITLDANRSSEDLSNSDSSQILSKETAIKHPSGSDIVVLQKGFVDMLPDITSDKNTQTPSKCSFEREQNRGNTTPTKYSKSPTTPNSFKSRDSKVEFSPDVIKTSSFTIFKPDKRIYNRPETDPKKTVSYKETPQRDIRTNSPKLKIVNRKTSFALLKGKYSEKNLFTRSSNKGNNKPNSKIKEKKIKKDEESLMKKAKNKAPHMDMYRNIITTGRVGYLSPNTIKRGTNVRLSRKASSSTISYKDDTGSEKRSAGYRRINLANKREQLYRNVEPRPQWNSSRRIDRRVEKTSLHGGISGYDINDLMNSYRVRKHKDDDERSSKTITLEERTTDDGFSMSSVESDARNAKAKKNKSPSKKRLALIKRQRGVLAVQGKPLKFVKDEPPEKPEESFESDSNRVEESVDAFTETVEPPNWFTTPQTEDVLKDLDNCKFKEDEIGFNQKSLLSYSDEGIKNEFAEPKSYLKEVRKKKIRSDAGDRQMLSSGGFFNSMTLQSKIKQDTKLRSGLTKSFREDKMEAFDIGDSLKLKRRNSEPHSFKGFVWKHADMVTPKGHKASVSSMASSLRHLNTDEIDDFIFWEAVPQRLTSYWEMSLYHFKRPWSVLSCSVFKDNRQSNTPGLILENLRNGRNQNLRYSGMSPKEQVHYSKENPFDVEPSIAQKNLDIRNWLAALNFSPAPSTSNDVIISEDSFSAQPTAEFYNHNKNQMCLKRRKILPSLKFSDETSSDKDYKKDGRADGKWVANEVGDLMELIRKKSGGFIAKEQARNLEGPTGCVVTTAPVTIHTDTTHKKTLLENATGDKIDFGTLRGATGQVEKSNPEDKQLVECPSNTQSSRSMTWLLKQELHVLPSGLNVWKYLFFLTLLIIIAHYCSLGSS